MWSHNVNIGTGTPQNLSPPQASPPLKPSQFLQWRGFGAHATIWSDASLWEGLSNNQNKPNHKKNV